VHLLKNHKTMNKRQAAAGGGVRSSLGFEGTPVHAGAPVPRRDVHGIRFPGRPLCKAPGQPGRIFRNQHNNDCTPKSRFSPTGPSCKGIEAPRLPALRYVPPHFPENNGFRGARPAGVRTPALHK